MWPSTSITPYPCSGTCECVCVCVQKWWKNGQVRWNANHMHLCQHANHSRTQDIGVIYYTINYVTCTPVIWTSISTLCRRTTDWDNGCRICRTHDTHIGANPTNTHTNSARIQFCHCKMEFANAWPPFVNVVGRGECVGGQNLNAIVSIYHGCRKICNQQQRRANLLQAQIACPHRASGDAKMLFARIEQPAGNFFFLKSTWLTSISSYNCLCMCVCIVFGHTWTPSKFPPLHSFQYVNRQKGLLVSVCK